MANKRKILENARKLAQRGSKARAMRQYKKLLRLDPLDVKLQLEIADAHRRWGQIGEALETYERIAGHYMEDGFDARAVAVYKQILSLAPNSNEVYTKLADLYQRMGLIGEALNALKVAADALKQRGKKVEALGLLRRMAALDPSNTTSRLKVAKLLRQEGMDEEALAEFEGLIGDLESEGDFGGAAEACRAALEIDPDRAKSCFALARNLVAQRIFLEAVAPARHALELEPDATEHYEVLLEALRGAELEDDLPAVYTRLAELHRDRGDEDQAREIMQRHVAPSSLDLGGEADFGLDSGLELAHPEPGLPSTPHPSEAPQVSDAARLSESGLALDEAGLDLPSLREPLAENQGAPLEEAALPAALPEFDLEESLVEAKALIGTGQHASAMQCLEKVLGVEAEHLSALSMLGEVQLAMGEPNRAVEIWERASKRARQEGDPARAAEFEARVLEAGGAVGNDAEAADPSRPEPPPDAFEIEIDLEGEAIPVESQQVRMASPDCSQEAPTLATDSGPALSEVLEEAEFYFRQGLNEEAKAIYQRILAGEPGQATALARLAELSEAPPESGVEIEASAPRQDINAGVQSAFLLDPGSALDLEPAGGAPALAELTPRELPGGEGFDLAAELSEILDDGFPEAISQGGADDGFTTVFDAFKKGVGEALEEGDHQAHFDLGIAYKEMGLHSDAVAEFRNAMSEPERRLECQHLIGLCALDAGDAGEAVECLEALLGEAGVQPELALSARFDLGRALVALGLPDRAREAFQAVADVDLDFRDVRAQLEALPAPAAVESEEAVEEDFENFEDLFAEDFGELPKGDDPGQAPDVAPEPAPTQPVAPEAAPARTRKKKISFA